MGAQEGVTRPAQYSGPGCGRRQDSGHSAPSSTMQNGPAGARPAGKSAQLISNSSCSPKCDRFLAQWAWSPPGANPRDAAVGQAGHRPGGAGQGGEGFAQPNRMASRAPRRAQATSGRPIPLMRYSRRPSGRQALKIGGGTSSRWAARAQGACSSRPSTRSVGAMRKLSPRTCAGQRGFQGKLPAVADGPPLPGA